MTVNEIRINYSCYQHRHGYLVPYISVVQPTKMGLRLKRPDPAFCAYTAGIDKPHYPVPSRIGTCDTEVGMVMLMHADIDWPYQPIVTWYNESYPYPLPRDHGVVDYVGN